MLQSTTPFFSSLIALGKSRSASFALSLACLFVAGLRPLASQRQQTADLKVRLLLPSAPPRISSILLLASLVVSFIPNRGFSQTGTNQSLQITKSLQMNHPEKTEPSGASTPDGLSMSKDVVKPAPVKRDVRVLEAAKMYEKYFLGQMMKAMRSTVAKSDLEKPSMGEGIYREQLDDQYVDSWGERGGIGLADMIHDELLGKAEMARLRRQAMKAARGKARTPTALTDRDVMTVRKLPNSRSNLSGKNSAATDGSTQTLVTETVLVSLGKTQSRAGDAPESVRSSWAGVISTIRSENGKTIIGVDAAAGDQMPARKIELAFDGVPFQVTEGDAIQAGQVVGQLGKSARGILIRQTLVQASIKPMPAAEKLGEPEL